MVGIDRLILALGQPGLVFRTSNLLGILLHDVGIVGALRGQDLVQQIELRWRQGRKERRDHHRLQVGPIDMQTRRCPVAGGEGRTRIAALRLVGDPHLVATAATDDEAGQERGALAWGASGLLRKGAGVICEPGLVSEELVPMNVRRIDALVHRRPRLERPSALPRPARTPVGMPPFAPMDKGARIRRVMQDLAQGGLRRFAPEQLARMESPMLAPWQAYPVITQTAEDFLATAEGRKAGKDQVESMLDLLVRIFDHRAVR